MVKLSKRESELALKSATIRCERVTQAVVCAVLNSSQTQPIFWLKARRAIRVISN
jgi:hypothetical protein